MHASSIRIQTIANGAGITYAKAEKIMKEMARVNRELCTLMDNPDNEDVDWEHTAGYIQGMRKALIMLGADGAVVDLLLKDLEAGRA